MDNVGLPIEQLTHGEKTPFQQKQVVCQNSARMHVSVFIEVISNGRVLLVQVLDQQVQEPRLQAPLLAQGVPIANHSKDKHSLCLCLQRHTFRFIAVGSLLENRYEVWMAIVRHNILQSKGCSASSFLAAHAMLHVGVSKLVPQPGHSWTLHFMG